MPVVESPLAELIAATRAAVPVVEADAVPLIEAVDGPQRMVPKDRRAWDGIEQVPLVACAACGCAAGAVATRV